MVKPIHSLLAQYSFKNGERGGDTYSRGHLFYILADRRGAYSKGVLIQRSTEKSAYEQSGHQARAYPGFCSMK